MANSTQNVPVSQILKSKSEFDDEPKKKSREDWRKAKELEEARKAGTAPAAVDEEGKDINPHIPQYISSAPWYYGQTGPTLKHQRPQEDKQKELSHLDEWYHRGVNTAAPKSTRFRKGACENCGALTHTKKDCMERPRKVGAKYNSANIAYDEHVQPKLLSSYDGKRDRWSGYDASEHKAIIEEFTKIEDAKRQLRAEKLNANVEEAVDDDDRDPEDEDKYVDEVDMPGTKVDSKQRITVRNLRIREDTAKYLRNLDPNSAYYDPKTRSMRDNPNPTSQDDEEDFVGENFVRFMGDTQKHAKAQVFAWDAYEKGVDVHLLAEPTKLEMLQKEYDKKKDQFKSQGQKDVLEKYGGEEHLDAPPKTLLLAQTEDYVEYSRYGTVIKGREKEIVRSRYEEDVQMNNHTSVWGSYWHTGHWGYKCCHSFVKNSYCVGEAGFKLNEPPEDVKDVNVTYKNENEPCMETPGGASIKEEVADSSSDSSSSDEDQRKSKKKLLKKQKKKEKKKQKKLDKKQKDSKKTLEEALVEEDRQKAEADKVLAMDERKRPYNSMFEAKKPTDEEMEAYLMKRRREEDPMRDFM